MEFLLQLINGISLGSIYALVSLGYTMVYGIAKLINFAHGDIIMVGAYTSLMSIPFLQRMGLPIWLSVVPAIIVCMIFGIAMERLAYRPLRKSPRIANLITAIGLSFLLQNGAMKIFGPNFRPYPQVINLAPVKLGGLTIGANVLITIGVTLVISLLLQVFVNKTKYGKAMIATSENYQASKLVGINIDNTIMMTFAIGTALAAVGSSLYVSMYSQVSPTMGGLLGTKAFVAAVLGGIGSIPGAVVGGFILGIIEALTRAYISTQLADAIVFAVLIIVLLVKPSGLMGESQKEKV